MDRRDFIINTALCSTALCFGCGCRKINNPPNEISITSVKLESCTLCQLSCPECWRNTYPNSRPLGYLKFKDFKKFVDNNSFVKKIDLTSLGEMFLNPDLNKIIKYGYKKNVQLTAETGVNLNTLSDETAELLVTQKFGKILISIDGASQETYSIYRRGGDFNKVIENIKKIQFYQKKYNDFEHPKLVWKFIPFGHNEHEIPKAKQMAKELGMLIIFSFNYAFNYSPIKNKEFVEKETGLNFCAINSDDNGKSYMELSYKKYLEDKNWFYCTGFFKDPVIYYDGKFLGCCMCDYNIAPDIDVFKLGLKNVLQSEYANKIKKIIKLEENADNTICQYCTVYKFIKENGIKIKI